MSPLHLAVYFSQDDMEKWENYEAVISVLLSTPIIGNDINQKDGLQRTALHWAAIRGFEKCIRFLLEHGADLAIKLSLKSNDFIHSQLFELSNRTSMDGHHYIMLLSLICLVVADSIYTRALYRHGMSTYRMMVSRWNFIFFMFYFRWSNSTSYCVWSAPR